MKKEESILQQWYHIWLDSHHILHNASVSAVKVSMGVAVQMKRAGYRKGYPDISIFEPRGKYHGMFVELKSSTGVASPEQEQWHKELTARGYYAVIMPALPFQKAQEWLKRVTWDYLSN
ncbi:MAG: VRR-NUC domain-containing protein [Candidatus Omnitrophota bacterium]